MRIHERIKQLEDDRKDLLGLVHDMLSVITQEKNHSGTIGDMHKEFSSRWVREFNLLSATDPGEI